MAENNTKIVISAEDRTGAALASVNKGLGSLQSVAGALTPLLGGLAGALSVGAFAGFAKGTIDAADNLNDLSQRIGIGVKDLATWKLAAQQSGTSLESVAKGVKGLSTYMTDHSEKLRKAGITATDANGAMTQLADIFAAMPDGIQKTALATQLFGKAGLEMIPMLNLGSKGLAEAQEKAKAYGEKMAELAPQADKFNDQLEELALQSSIAGINLGALVAGPMAEWLEAQNQANKISGGLTETLRLFVFNLDAMTTEKPREEIERLTKEVEKFKKEMESELRAPFIDQNLIKDHEKKIEFLKFLERRDAMSGAAKFGDYRDSKDLRLANGRTMSVAEAMAKAAALSDKSGTKKASRGIIGPDDVLDNIREAVAKQNRADYIAGEKELADAIDASNKALNKQNEELGKQIAAAEHALDIYGLTESQIADLTLARLKDNRAREAAQDADEATLAHYDKEIAALERIRAAKFAVEAKDAAKKAAEEATKSWENFTRDIESSLTDALMRSFEAGDSFGEAFADNLKNIFKTMILKAAVQITVGTVSGAVQQATGVSFGGSGGGGGSLGSIGNLLSTGQSLYGAFTGGTAATLGGLVGGSFGAGMQGASLAAGLAGPTTAGASGAMGAGAMAASAMPWVAGALAIASIFGGKLFGSKKPAPVEWGLRDTPLSGYQYGSTWDQYTSKGPFTSITSLGQHLSRNGLSAGSLKTSVTDPLVELDKVLAQYLDGGEISKVAVALMLGNEGEHGWSQAAVEGVMMRRLNRISDAIGGWTDKLFDTTTGDIQKRYQELAQILSVRGDAEMEQLAQDMFNATGQWSFEKFGALQGGVSNFKSLFGTDADRLADYTAAMGKAFASLNIALPESRDGFKSLVEGIDTSTKAGFELYATLIDLSPTMAAYYDALSQELDVKKQLASMAESGFASAVDYRRYQGVAANYDATLAGDYAYNIRLGAIKPGSAANGDIVAELRALRAEQQAQSLAIATNTQDTAKLLRRWNGDGMPAERVVA